MRRSLVIFLFGACVGIGASFVYVHLISPQTTGQASVTQKDPTFEDVAGKKGEAFDQAFLGALLSRDEETLTLLRASLLDATNGELRSFIRKLIDSTQIEVTQLQEWKDSGFE